MPILTGTIDDVTGSPLPDRVSLATLRVTVRAPSRRSSLAEQARLVASVPVPVEVSPTGEISVELEPGPAVMLVEGEGLRDVYELGVTADMTLLTEALQEMSPTRSWVESQMVQLRAATVTAAGDAQAAKSDAEGAAAVAEGHRTHVDAIRDLLDEAAQTNVAPYLTETALKSTYDEKGAALPVAESGARFDVLPARATGRTGQNARGFQRTSVIPGPNPGDYYAVWIDENRVPRVASYSAGAGQFDMMDLSLLSGNPMNSPASSDDHRALTIARDAAGHLHIAGNSHGSLMQYIRSAAPDNIQDWVIVSAAGVPGPAGAPWSAVGYPQFIPHDGKLLLMFRDGTSSSGDFYLQEITNTTEIGTARKIFSGKPTTTGPYLNTIHIDGMGRMHIWFTWRNKYSAGNGDFGYVYTDDLGVTMHAAGGASVAVPVVSTNTVPLIETGDLGYINQCGAEVINGVAHGLVRDYSSTIFHFVRDGTQWVKTPVATAPQGNLGRPGMVATSDGRGFAIYRKYETVMARQIVPTMGDEFALFPYSVGGGDSGWEPVPDIAYLRETDRLRMIVTPTEGAPNQTNALLPSGPGTWIGVYTTDLNAQVKPSLDRAMQAVPYPSLPQQRIAAKPLSADSVIYNSGHNRWVVTGGARSTAAFPSARWYGAPVRFSHSGNIIAAGVNVSVAGSTGATVEVVIMDPATGQAIARTDPAPADTVGAKEMPFTSPVPVAIGRDFYLGAIVWGSTTPTTLVSTLVADPAQNGPNATTVLAGVPVGYRSASDLAPGATNLSNVVLSTLAPVVAVKTARRTAT